MKETPKDPVSKRLVAPTEAGQRLDNYLFKHLKGVPKSYIYRIIRGGQVRINGGRVKPSSRLADGDTVRIPPLRQASEKSREPNAAPDFKISTLFEDEHLLIVDKPSGCAVHSGSGHDYGLIEILRSRMTGYLELIHRLDKETSGVLMLAKDPMALRQMHLLFSSRNELKSIQKFYTALLVGEWRGGSRTLTHSLETVRGTVGAKRSKVRLRVFHVPILKLVWMLDHPSPGNPFVGSKSTWDTLRFFALCSKPTPLPPKAKLLIS